MACNYFSSKTHKQIKNLYWNEGYDTEDLAIQFKCDRSTITRILNDLIVPIDMVRASKKLKYQPNYIPSPTENPIAKIVRCARRQLNLNKLSAKEVSDIRNLYFRGTFNQIELADLYRVSQSEICKVITGDKWKKCAC